MLKLLLSMAGNYGKIKSCEEQNNPMSADEVKNLEHDAVTLLEDTNLSDDGI